MIQESIIYLAATAILIAAIMLFFWIGRGRYTGFGIAQLLLRILVALPLCFSAIYVHFLHTNQATAMLPPVFPETRLLILVTGVAELLGAIGLFVPRTRRSAALWIAILMVMVFPANIYISGLTYFHIAMPGVPPRLIAQIVYVWMVLLAGYGLPRRESQR